MDPALLRQECLTHLQEGRRRLRHCVDLLDDIRLWHRPNPHVVSVGNLVLHLCGNVGQWVNSTLGGDTDRRQRDKEFEPGADVPRAALLALLGHTMDRALDVIGKVTEVQLATIYRVQVFDVTGVGILVHVVEHFSYHVGQVTLHTKLLLNVDTGYYAGKDL